MRTQRLFTWLVPLLLVGCGGGGGAGGAADSSAPVVSGLSFPFQSALSALTASGYTKTYAISGDCSGTATDSTGPATAGVAFEGSSSTLSAVSVTTITFTNCTPASSTSTETVYYDTNYTPLGAISADGTYLVYSTSFNIPASVVVGVSQNIGSIYRYSDSTKASLLRRADVSFIVEPETAATAIINLVTVMYAYDASVQGFNGVVVQQYRARIRTIGPLEPLSIEQQISPSSRPTIHLLFQ